MDSAPPPASPPGAPPPNLVLAWPRSAQLATAFLLGVALTLIACHALGYLRLGTRPSQLDQGYRIDLNRADRAELLQLPRVGERLADRIEGKRRERGGFERVQDLGEVKGVGPATLRRLGPWVAVEPGEG